MSIPADEIFREIDGDPIRWQDENGTLHAVEGTALHDDIELYWTLCGHDIEGGMFVLSEVDTDGLDCPACKRLNALPPQPPGRAPLAKINTKLKTLLDLAQNHNQSDGGQGRQTRR